MNDFENAEKVLQQVLEKISPAVLEIAARRDSGKIEIHFSTGVLKFSNKQVTL